MTKLRIIKVNQTNLEIALQNNTWGRKRMGFKDWEKGDHLLFIVNLAVAGYALVDGRPFKSEDIYWGDDLYPNRIPIKKVKTWSVGERISYTEWIKPILVDEWGKSFGWQILTQQAMAGPNAEKVLKMVGFG
jgi:hypothetical protein